MTTLSQEEIDDLVKDLGKLIPEKKPEKQNSFNTYVPLKRKPAPQYIVPRRKDWKTIYKCKRCGQIMKKISVLSSFQKINAIYCDYCGITKQIKFF